ncbi:antitoxin Xre/MbcA/ParS toxin-binding domain-containing protein [Thiohalospira sp.]|uniref:antitoxin Xre/MbcA/ParS toxin-binding domain-containing protein n=1 Tax=Thiohalospira sp. TaxID=3080549 RepID=UPI0039817E69
MSLATAPNSTQEDRRVLTEAAVNTARQLGLSNAELAQVLGVSQSSTSRMRQGHYLLEPGSKSWEAALLLVRLYRSLGAILAGDETAMRQWLDNPNRDLGDAPRDLIRTTSGLVHVVDYLDAHRAVV